MTTQRSLLRLTITTAICVVAALGFQLLPQDDYQPSRPLYALGWLGAALGLYIWSRRRHDFVKSLARMLIVIFAILLTITLLM